MKSLVLTLSALVLVFITGCKNQDVTVVVFEAGNAPCKTWQKKLTEFYSADRSKRYSLWQPSVCKGTIEYAVNASLTSDPEEFYTLLTSKKKKSSKCKLLVATTEYFKKGLISGGTSPCTKISSADCTSLILSAKKRVIQFLTDLPKHIVSTTTSNIKLQSVYESAETAADKLCEIL